MAAPKVIVILLLLSSCVLLNQASIKIGPVSGTKINTHHLQKIKTNEGNAIVKKQEVFVPSPRELYDDYGRTYDYPFNQLPIFRGRYLDREPISTPQQFPLSSSVILKNYVQPRQEYIPRRRFGYDVGLISSRDDNNNQFLDTQDYENMLERNGNLEEVPFEHAAKYQEEVIPIEGLRDTRVSEASPLVPTSQDMSYSEFLRARPVVGDYPQRISSPVEPVTWQQEGFDLKAKAEALKAKAYLKHLIEEVGPTVTLKQVLDKYGPKVPSLFSDLQYASGARFPNPINETKLSPKPAEIKQRKQQKLFPQKHQKDVSNEMGTKTDLTKSNLKTLKLASEVTKDAKDFIKIFRWFNKYYKNFKHKTTNVDNITKGDKKDNVRKKKVRIEKNTKKEEQGKERTSWNYKKMENLLNNL